METCTHLRKNAEAAITDKWRIATTRKQIGNPGPPSGGDLHPPNKTIHDRREVETCTRQIRNQTNCPRQKKQRCQHPNSQTMNRFPCCYEAALAPSWRGLPGEVIAPLAAAHGLARDGVINPNRLLVIFWWGSVKRAQPRSYPPCGLGGNIAHRNGSQSATRVFITHVQLFSCVQGYSMYKVPL